MGHKPWDRVWRRADKARERNAAYREMLDDMYDVVEVEQRKAAETGERVELDDFLAELKL